MNVKYLIWVMMSHGQSYCYVIKDGRGHYFMDTASYSQSTTRDKKSASWWVNNPAAAVAQLSIIELLEEK